MRDSVSRQDVCTLTLERGCNVEPDKWLVLNNEYNASLQHCVAPSPVWLFTG